ncbi:hypothetical protein Gotur_011360 [Gossypium turneri]
MSLARIARQMANFCFGSIKEARQRYCYCKELGHVKADCYKL